MSLPVLYLAGLILGFGYGINDVVHSYIRGSFTPNQYGSRRDPWALLLQGLVIGPALLTISGYFLCLWPAAFFSYRWAWRKAAGTTRDQVLANAIDT